MTNNKLPKMIREMTNIKFGEFDYDGSHWYDDHDKCKQGTSSKGIWNEYTNGEKIVVVYKKDMLKRSFEDAKTLFHEM